MSEGLDPIDPVEIVLRRIPAKPGYYDRQKMPPVDPGAFRPNPNDLDGLSFYRERDVSVETVADSGTSGTLYAVARLLAGDIYTLGVTLIPNELPDGLPGHVLLPEINKTSYDNKPENLKIKVICRELTKLANKNLIQPGGFHR